jgi:4-amino-4-deoxy-L-arabinose transferase-like glycosyltransferase
VKRTLSYPRAIALVTALGGLVRLVLLARQPLGYDEDFTAAVVLRPFGDMIGVVSHDTAPPLFYVLEWLVSQVAGGGPAALRFVPALAGIALIPLLAALARRVAGDSAGLWAAAFVAVLPATLLVSENARMHSEAGALVVAAILLAWRAVERPGLGRWAVYTVVAAVAVWTDYFAAVALLGVLVAVAWLRPGRRELAGALVATAVAFASLVPWLLFARDQFGHAGLGFWIPPLGVESVGGTFGQMFGGPPVDSGVPYRELLIALQVVAIGAAAAALGGLAGGWRRLPMDARRGAIFCLLACSGVVALAAVSLVRPLFEARYAGVMWLPLFALAGVGLAAVPRRLAAALLVAMAVPSLALGTTITHPETASLLPEIEAAVGPHDLVAADLNHYFLVLAEGTPAVRARLHILAASDPAWYFGVAAYPPGAVVHAAPADVASARGTIFWIADPGSAPPSLPAGYRQSAQRCAIRVCLTTYSPAG